MISYSGQNVSAWSISIRNLLQNEQLSHQILKRIVTGVISGIWRQNGLLEETDTHHECGFLLLHPSLCLNLTSGLSLEVLPAHTLMYLGHTLTIHPLRDGRNCAIAVRQPEYCWRH